MKSMVKRLAISLSVAMIAVGFVSTVNVYARSNGQRTSAAPDGFVNILEGNW